MMEFLDAHYDGLLFILISIFCFAYGLLKKQQKLHLLKNGIKTTGTVVDYKLQKSNGSFRLSVYCPIIEFEDNQGVLRQLVCDFGFSYKMFKDNQQVEVYFDATDFQKFVINDSKTRIFGYLFTIVGAVLLLCGIYLFINNQETTSVIGS